MSASTDAFAAGIQAVAAALLAAMPTPADALRLLGGLGNFAPVPAASTTPIGAAIATMTAATGDLCRRAAIVALARAASTYQPWSYDDAIAVRDQVCAVLDAEIQVAGDQAEDASFTALRALRAAVSQDLTARGASLAPIATVVAPSALPAPVLAQRLYQDATRSDELVAEADPPHPAFMPVSFRALAR